MTTEERKLFKTCTQVCTLARRLQKTNDEKTGALYRKKLTEISSLLSIGLNCLAAIGAAQIYAEGKRANKQLVFVDVRSANLNGCNLQINCALKELLACIPKKKRRPTKS